MNKRPQVVVVGSANVDMIVCASRLPKPGETVLGGEFTTAAGGKGANQAVAAARLGADVVFVACVGADSLGDQAVLGYEAEGIDTHYLVRDPDAPTGVALIGVDQTTGENFIIVASGANSCLSPALAALASEAIRAADVVLCQLESPLETVTAALKMARDAGVITILNPAPAREIPETLLQFISIMTPNEHEAAFLVGNVNASPEQAGLELHRRGVPNVVVTLGSAGVLLVNKFGTQAIAGLNVAQVVDTTAAGDCFSGALAVGLAEGKPLEEAILFANATAALSVTKPGAQPSLPTRAAANQFLMDQVFFK